MFEENSQYLAGGVGSSDRALVQPHPIFIDRGLGSHMWDVDGNEYVDYLLGYGPLVLGHAHPLLVDAVSRQMKLGSIYGAGHSLEVTAAKKPRRTDAEHGIGQVRPIGHRGHSVRDSDCARGDRPPIHRQVRGPLSRVGRPKSLSRTRHTKNRLAQCPSRSPCRCQKVSPMAPMRI